MYTYTFNNMGLKLNLAAILISITIISLPSKIICCYICVNLSADSSQTSIFLKFIKKNIQETINFQWEWVVITDLKNMADYIALQYFVFLQKDLATSTTNEGWSFLISGIWRTIRSTKHLRHPKR